MAMTVNPATTPGTAAPSRDEGLYVFRFDTDGDARKDVSFKVHFGQIAHRHDENDHVQSLEVRRAAGQDAGTAPRASCSPRVTPPRSSPATEAFRCSLA